MHPTQRVAILMGVFQGGYIMPLDPQAQALLQQMAAANAQPFNAQTVEENRQALKAMYTPKISMPVAHVKDRIVQNPGGDIPVRIYTPEGNGPFPVLVFFHGGGWVVGDLETHDDVCRRLTNGTSCIVVSVEYRLAPEHPFPASLEDCYAATQWVATAADQFHGDPSRIAVGGASAGGNLAAAVALMARDKGNPPLVFQLLLYPATDFRMNTASIEENADGYYLTKQDIIWFMHHYLSKEEDKLNPLASPLLAADLGGLPPALVITAEYDPLRDEGELYGQKLKEAGVPTTVSRYNGMIHGFVSLASIFDQGKRGIAECCAALQAAFRQE